MYKTLRANMYVQLLLLVLCVGAMEPEATKSKTTIVLMGFSPQRTKNYVRLFQLYGRMDKVLDQVVVIWCNEDASPPPLPPKITKVPITIVLSKGPSLNNRYSPEVEDAVRTESVFHMDDDLCHSEELIEQMLKAWIAQPDLLVGCNFDARFANESKRYQLTNTNPSDHHIRVAPNMVLTKAMLHHRKYLNMYWKQKEMLRFVDKVRGCEDIGMNAVVHNYTRQNPIVFEANGHRKTLNPADGLSTDHRPAYYLSQLRTRCVRFMMQHFGQNVFWNHSVAWSSKKIEAEKKCHGSHDLGIKDSIFVDMSNRSEIQLTSDESGEPMCLCFPKGYSATGERSITNVNVVLKDNEVWAMKFGVAFYPVDCKDCQCALQAVPPKKNNKNRNKRKK
eukprot:m.93781 g.93781  ORF g.93781 m.93781 type:complete len:391 (-) comp26652_c1_seq2:102-1274(-)